MILQSLAALRRERTLTRHLGCVQQHANITAPDTAGSERSAGQSASQAGAQPDCLPPRAWTPCYIPLQGGRLGACVAGASFSPADPAAAAAGCGVPGCCMQPTCTWLPCAAWPVPYIGTCCRSSAVATPPPSPQQLLCCCCYAAAAPGGLLPARQQGGKQHAGGEGGGGS